MTRHVLVPLDGSDKDERALTAAAAMAELTGADIQLIRVLDVPISSLSERARTMGVLDAARENLKTVHLALTEWVARLTAETGRPVTMQVAEGYDVAQVLLDRSAQPDVECVVMGTRAPGTIVRAIRGSVADRVMRESPRPVLLVPPGADRLSAYKILFRRVLVPLDGSPLALAALDQLASVSAGANLEYVLLEVVVTAFTGTPLEPKPRSVRQQEESARLSKQANQRLEQAADRIRAHGASVHTSAFEHSDPASGIRIVAKKEGVDFIAMSTRGLSGFQRFMFGGVTEDVVRQGDLPILLMTPQKQGR